MAQTEQLRQFYSAVQLSQWLSAVAENAARERAERKRQAVTAIRSTGTVPLPPAPTGCTNNSPLPASVIQGESGGQCDAYNPTGCGGRGCIGYAQLDAGHFAAVSPWNPNVHGTCYGLSYDACVDKLFAGGAGLCQHWSKC